MARVAVAPAGFERRLDVGGKRSRCPRLLRQLERPPHELGEFLVSGDPIPDAGLLLLMGAADADARRGFDRELDDDGWHK